MKVKELYSALEELGPQNYYYLSDDTQMDTYFLDYLFQFRDIIRS